MPLPLLGSQAASGCRRDGRVGETNCELHGLLIDLEEGRILTPDLKGQILSLGERLSSEIVAATFDERECMSLTATHATRLSPTRQSLKQLREAMRSCDAL